MIKPFEDVFSSNIYLRIHLPEFEFPSTSNTFLGPESAAYQLFLNKWIKDDRLPKYYFYYYVDEKKLYCWDSETWAMYRWRTSLEDMEFLHHAEVDVTNQSFSHRKAKKPNGRRSLSSFQVFSNALV